MPSSDLRTRRRWLQAVMSTTATSALGALGTLATLSDLAVAAGEVKPQRMPVLFIGHGSPMNAISENDFTRTLRGWAAQLPKPSALLVVSAHWLTPGATAVQVSERPKTIHDFGGFPKALFDMQYPAPGAPAFAREAQQVVRRARVLATEQWGLDHGTWTVLHHLYPAADVPVFQLSIDYAQPAAFHHAIGRELQPLRDRGVLIVGSGNVVHNLGVTDRGLPPSDRASRPWAQAFDDAVKAALEARDDRALVEYQKLGGGSAAIAVETPDHYYPFLYSIGARDPLREPAKTVYEGFHSGTLGMRCVQFG